MIKAAGILLRAKSTGRVLLLKRGAASDHPLEWCTPGGQMEDEDADAASAAIRETLEECGFDAKDERLRFHTRTVAPGANVPTPIAAGAEASAAMPAGAIAQDLSTAVPPAAAIAQQEQVDFTCFLLTLTDEFTATLCDEHTGWAWTDPGTPPLPLHPGAAVALARLTWNELGVAKAIQAGQLTSPQQYENLSLFAMRVTGTGKSYRPQLKEYVWRPPEVYLTPEFCERCAGLPVIMQHPKIKPMLDGKELGDRIVGTVMFAYVQGDEVWCIAKIIDENAADIIVDLDLSTSPGVVFKDKSTNQKVKLEDGSDLLVEGDPDLLDHLAVCRAGVWDKDGASQGIAIHDETVTVTSCHNKLDRKTKMVLARAAALTLQVGNFQSQRDLAGDN